MYARNVLSREMVTIGIVAPSMVLPYTNLTYIIIYCDPLRQLHD